MLKDSRRPIPQALRQRLRDIPRREVLCRDVDRLYRTALSRVRPGDRRPRCPEGAQAELVPRDAFAERHLAECPRCGELYATLTSALAVRRLAVPRRLAGRLSSIARHPELFLPIWIADTRYAAAACYLLAALALSLAGDASALLRDTTSIVSSKAQVWVDESEARGLEAWDATAAKVEKSIDGGWNRIMRYGTSCDRFFTNAFTTIATSIQESVPPKGDKRNVSPEGDKRNVSPEGNK